MEGTLENLYRAQFQPIRAQGVHKVCGTQLDENGRYQAIDLE
jgi:hypothetical protein